MAPGKQPPPLTTKKKQGWDLATAHHCFSVSSTAVTCAEVEASQNARIQDELCVELPNVSTKDGIFQIIGRFRGEISRDLKGSEQAEKVTQI